MSLKIPKINAIEVGHQPTKSTDIILSGQDGLCKLGQGWEFSIKNGSISSNNLFSKIFEPTDVFFYYIEKYKNSKVIISEKGLGKLENNSVKRLIPIEQFSEDGIKRPQVLFNFQNQDSDELTVISSVYPSNFFELLVDKNTIVSSSDKFAPLVIKLENNSLLACVNDSVQSYNIDNLFTLDSFSFSVIKCISTFKNQLSLNSSKLISKNIQTNILQFSPTTKPITKKGVLYFDNNDNSLKVFDGSSWRRLKYEDS